MGSLHLCNHVLARILVFVITGYINRTANLQSEDIFFKYELHFRLNYAASGDDMPIQEKNVYAKRHRLSKTQ